MRQQIDRFVALAFASADLLIEVAPTGEIGFAMGAATSLLGLGETELVGRRWLDLFHPGDRLLIDTLLQSLEVGARCGPVAVRTAFLDETERHRDVLVSACRLPTTADRLSCALSTVPPALARQAGAIRRDLETQLLDTESFASVVGDAAHSAGHLSEKVKVNLVELPELRVFAQENPVLGRTLVHRVATLLRAAAIDGGTAGRLADHRFGVLCDSNSDGLARRLDDIVTEGVALGVDLTVNHQSFDLGGSTLSREETVKAIRFVVNRFAHDGAAAGAVTSVADAFEQMVEATVKDMKRFASIVREERFDLAFQPIVEIATGRLHHFEVLARFEENKSPFERIRFAEEIGLIERFDLAVCSRALAMLREGADQSPPPRPLAVNLSGRSIGNPVFVQLLLKLLGANVDLRHQLMLEITESAQIKDLFRINAIIQQIRQRGFVVCLDDFGAGAASFQYLQALTIDYVKIDGSYVQRIGQSPRDDVMLKGIVRLCQDLGIGTIAEMVETPEQAMRLRALGVPLGQGWLYGKATAAPVWQPRREKGARDRAPLGPPLR